MSRSRWRNILISVFVVLWTFCFHYESTRYFFLNPLFKRDLPKINYLYPPAGWIMFFQVGQSSGYAEVYGLHDGQWQPIDPHHIFRTRFVGFDNIHRGVLGAALSPENQKPFCRYLKRRFPGYTEFQVRQIYYPAVVDDPLKRLEGGVYGCR